MCPSAEPYLNSTWRCQVDIVPPITRSRSSELASFPMPSAAVNRSNSLRLKTLNSQKRTPSSARLSSPSAARSEPADPASTESTRHRPSHRFGYEQEPLCEWTRHPRWKPLSQLDCANPWHYIPRVPQESC